MAEIFDDSGISFSPKTGALKANGMELVLIAALFDRLDVGRGDRIRIPEIEFNVSERCLRKELKRGTMPLIPEAIATNTRNGELDSAELTYIFWARRFRLVVGKGEACSQASESGGPNEMPPVQLLSCLHARLGKTLTTNS